MASMAAFQYLKSVQFFKFKHILSVNIMKAPS